jgi:hypothetical protein
MSQVIRVRAGYERATGCLFALLFLAVGCLGVRSWLATPKVSVAGVEADIRTDLPIGSLRKEVETWLTARSMPVQEYNDGRGSGIGSWIPDSGPRSEWPFGIRDIRVRFTFSPDGRLSDFAVQEEDRF